MYSYNSACMCQTQYIFLSDFQAVDRPCEGRLLSTSKSAFRLCRNSQPKFKLLLFVETSRNSPPIIFVWQSAIEQLDSSSSYTNWILYLNFWRRQDTIYCGELYGK